MKMSKKNNQNLWIPITGFFMLCSFAFLIITFFDNDGWFILNNGRYILEHGIPQKNPFTWMEGLDIVIQQWLWSVIAYFMYDKIGNLGLILLCMIMYALTMFLFVKIADLYDVKHRYSIPFCAIMLLLMYPYLSIRPTFVTIILLLWQVYVLEKYKITGDALNLLWLITISILEINMHSAIWVFHFVFLLPYIVPEIQTYFVKFEKVKMKRLPLILISIPMFLVGYCNPYGINGMKYLLYAYGDELTKAGITELKPPALNGVGIFILLLVVIAAIWIASHYHKKFQSSFIYILCGTMILSLSHSRNAVYFYLGFMLFAIEILKNIDYNKNYKKITCIASIFVVALWIICISVCYGVIQNASIKSDSELHPVKAIEYLKKHNIPDNTRLYTEFNSGGFIGWNGYKTFMDARPELYFKTLNSKIDAFHDYNKLRKETNPKAYEKFIDKYQFEWMIVSDEESCCLYLDMSTIAEVKMKGNGYKLYQVIRETR